MAAFSHRRSGTRSSVGLGQPNEDLPNGSCDFRDLNLGARAATCGCKRFWLNNNHLNGHDWVTAAFCFCGHHACFHTLLSQPSHAAEHQEQHVDRSDAVLQGTSDTEAARHRGSQPSSPQTRPAGLGIRAVSQDQSQSINTRVWEALNQFAREQEEGGASDTSSKLPSTAVPSVVGDEARASPQRPAQQYRPMGPPVSIPAYSTNVQGGEDYSATEVATPSIAGTPDFRALAPPGVPPRTSPPTGRLVRPALLDPQVSNAQQTVEIVGNARSFHAARQSGDPPEPSMSARDLQSMLQSYGQRLDVLENLSFHHVSPDEIHEKFDLVDGRLIDLEQWRTDLERQQLTPEPAGPSNSKRRRLLPTETSSFASDGSFDSNAALHTEAAVLATLAVGPQIDALEARVADLENNAPPSFARPWHVQVVLLPWDRDLRGIWFSSAEATQHSLNSTAQASQEWPGLPAPQNLSFKSSASAAWTTESIQAWADEAQEWLSPKACGPSGTVFQRLASRGLVREVTLTAPDARHISDRVNSCFNFCPLNSGDEAPERTKIFQGLAENFIPLRKVRKSSRLRFLSPPEMVTSACWTASFLDSSVVMKVNDGQRRLYVTTRDAYLQPGERSWSWQKIKELPLFDADGEERAAQADGVAIEACWTYNEHLDQSWSTRSSFTARDLHWSTRDRHVDEPPPGDAENPISPRSDTRHSRQRTASLPSQHSAAQRAKEALPKRRVASFETGATVPLHAERGISGSAKRRRISTSPEAERKGVGLTPRWSNEPPSPFTSENVVLDAHSQGGGSRKRGNASFAYATPHSNNRIESLGGDGDTEADTEVAGPQSLHGEDEWHGVEDATIRPAQQSDGESGVEEAEIDEDDLEDGPTTHQGA